MGMSKVGTWMEQDALMPIILESLGLFGLLYSVVVCVALYRIDSSDDFQEFVRIIFPQHKYRLCLVKYLLEKLNISLRYCYCY